MPSRPRTLEERLRFETLLADLSSKFVNLPAGEVDREIIEMQRRICEFLDLDLVVLWQQLGEVPDFFSTTHFYSAPQAPQPPERLHQEDYPWFRQQLLADRIISFASLQELPEAAARDRESFLQLGIKSNLCLPLSVGGGPLIGAYSLNAMRAEREWPDALVNRLRLVAEIFANALARKRDEQALRASEINYRTLVEMTGTGYLILDLQGRVLDANQEYVRMTGHGELREIIGRSVIEWTAEKAKQWNAEAVAQCALNEKSSATLNK